MLKTCATSKVVVKNRLRLSFPAAQFHLRAVGGSDRPKLPKKKATAHAVASFY